MKKTAFTFSLTIVVAAAIAPLLAADGTKPVPPAPPRKVALVVQNHTSDAPTLPMAAFADTLTARLSGNTLRIVNPHNVIGVNQNRTAKGEVMPEASVQEIGRMLGADGVITASIQEFTGEDIGVPAIAHTLKVRLSLNLADAATGETVCGVDGVEFSKNYTAEKVKSDTATLYEGLMHLAAAKAADKLLVKVASVGWEQNAAKTIDVFFGCNVLGADVQIDGLSYGTCPAQLTLTPGVHNLIIKFPPYYYEFRRRAIFNQEGQTYKVVLQITPDGEVQRARALEYAKKLYELSSLKKKDASDYEKKKKLLDAEIAERCQLFKKQLEIVDAMLDRYEESGNADDYVRMAIADGTATYWKQSYGRIAITEGTAENIEFTTPSADLSDLVVPPEPMDIQRFIKHVGK